MKLPDYAKELGISYKTAWRWWKAGKLPHPASQTGSGLVLVDYRPHSGLRESTVNWPDLERIISMSYYKG